MLNGTLCATTRALCCIAENYQTPEVCICVYFEWETHAFQKGMNVPKVLQPYMGGREFLPFAKELPKGLGKKKA